MEIGLGSITIGLSVWIRSGALETQHVQVPWHWLRLLLAYKWFTVKSFSTLTDAEHFLAGTDVSLGGGSSLLSRFYAVRSGRVPGIYTDWPSAQKQILGGTRPRHKCFSTRAEAQKFLDGDDQNSTEGTDTVLADMDVSSNAEHDPESSLKRSAPEKLKKIIPSILAKTSKPIVLEYNEDAQEPGTGPLPPDSEDGFDSNVILDAKSGQIVYKSESQRKVTKIQAAGLSGTNNLRIYTDGSSLRNGAQGALAGVGVYFGPRDERYARSIHSYNYILRTNRNVSEALSGPRQTNQRAELTAVLRALEIVPRNRNVTIVTDSRYAIDCITVWYINWRKNGWKTAAGKAVENKDLVEHVLAKIEERNGAGVKTLFEWIKGHASHPGNVEADKLAVNGARNNNAPD